MLSVAIFQLPSNECVIVSVAKEATDIVALNFKRAWNVESSHV